ncbi:hypothetical protein BBJ28_00019142, partial [Nothophytophthora sp. Chile5]
DWSTLDHFGIFTSRHCVRESTSGFSDARWETFSTFDEAEKHLRLVGMIVCRYGLQCHDGTHRIWNAYDVMHASDNVIVAFCRSNSLWSGRRGLTAAFACQFPHHRDWNVKEALDEAHATSLRADYYAALAALKRADRVDPQKHKALVIFSDAEELIYTVRMWLSTWSRNGWRKSDGSPVKNRDLMEQLVDLSEGRDVMYRLEEALVDGQVIVEESYGTSGHGREFAVTPTTIMDAAAVHGHLDVLQFLHDLDQSVKLHRSERGRKLEATRVAMDGAAERGHLEIVK